MIFSFHRALNSHDVAAPVTPQVQTTSNFLFFVLKTSVFSTTINNQGLILKKNTRCKKCRATSTTTSRWRPRTCGGWTSSTERPLARWPPTTLNISITTITFISLITKLPTSGVAHNQQPGEVGAREHERRSEVHRQELSRVGVHAARGGLRSQHPAGGHCVERGGAQVHPERQGQVQESVGAPGG